MSVADSLDPENTPFEQMGVDQAVAYLKENPSAVAPSDQKFVNSLLKKYDKYGDPTPAQVKWIKIMAQKAKDGGTKTIQLENAAEIFEAMNKLKAKGEKPVLWVPVSGDKGLARLHMPSKGKHLGMIMVTNGLEYNDTAYKWYGVIRKDGTFEQASHDPDVETAVALFTPPVITTITASAVADMGKVIAAAIDIKTLTAKGAIESVVPAADSTGTVKKGVDLIDFVVSAKELLGDGGVDKKEAEAKADNTAEKEAPIRRKVRYLF